MKNFLRSPFTIGILMSFLLVGIIAGAVFVLNWWNTPLGPALDFSTHTPAGEDLQVTQETITPDPTQSLTTPTPTPTLLPTYTPSPTVIPKPQAMCGGPDTFTFLVTGVDAGNYVYGLSDAIRVVRVDFIKGKIVVLPLPRDLWVDIPVSIPGATRNITPGKLNQAYFYGSPGMGYYDGEDQSPGLLAKTLKSNFNLEMDRYFSVNTRIFRQMVNQIGGITVTLPDTVYRHYFGDPRVYMKAGTHHLNGKEAEMVARHRTVIGDFGRMKNQTILLKAFVRKLLTPSGLKELPELIDIYEENVLMDFTPNEISKLLCLASKIDLQEDVTFLTFPKDMVSEGRMYDEVQQYNAYALTYDRNELYSLLAAFQAGFWP